eukprot:1690031-Pyramimonas_sp.AAC.1
MPLHGLCCAGNARFDRREPWAGRPMHGCPKRLLRKRSSRGDTTAWLRTNGRRDPRRGRNQRGPIYFAGAA